MLVLASALAACGSDGSGLTDGGPREEASISITYDGSVLVIPDGAFNFLDVGLLNDGAVPYTVAVSRAVRLSMNLRPPAAADPIEAAVDLEFRNYGSVAETISVSGAAVSCPGAFLQRFQAGPEHVASPGNSTATVTKTAGTGSLNPVFPSALCDLPCVVSLLLSTTQPLDLPATMSCTR